MMLDRLRPDHSRLGAFAGDVGVAGGCISSTLAITLPVWCIAAGAAGLVLKIEGVQIVMPKLPDRSVFIARLRALGVRGQKFILTDTGKNLGL
eukprot:8138268-Pyramimonas_sp.AAC.1